MGIVEDLAALIVQLQLLGGVAPFLKLANVGDHIVGDLMGKGDGGHALPRGQSPGLLQQLHRPRRPGTGHRLVAGCHQGANGAQRPQAMDGGQGDGSGAVGVGQNALVPGHILPVDLRDHQGHVGIQAKRRGIIHKDGAVGHNFRRQGPGDGGFCRAQDDVHPGKGRPGGLFHVQRLPPEGDGLAGTLGAGQRQQGGNGEIPLLQHPEHLPPHGPGGPQNGYGVCFHRTPPVG